MSGGDLAEATREQLHGLLVVVTFASYLRDAGPFFVAADDLDRFVAEHADLFDEVFFSGDVTIIRPTTRGVIAVHP